jgi:uncharacterized protein YjbJ (UPF0337 family)
MGSTADKASGVANEAIGKAKQGIGKVVGSEKLQADGAAQEVKGDGQRIIGEAKAGLKSAAEQDRRRREPEPVSGNPDFMEKGRFVRPFFMCFVPVDASNAATKGKPRRAPVPPEAKRRSTL